jgi:hypothetical protein
LINSERRTFVDWRLTASAIGCWARWQCQNGDEEWRPFTSCALSSSGDFASPVREAAAEPGRSLKLVQKSIIAALTSDALLLDPVTAAREHDLLRNCDVVCQLAIT